jgi:hypothetical protein
LSSTKKTEFNDVPKWIQRRAEFVYNEAKLQDRKHDQTVKYALRVLSNWATVGIDGSSERVKRRNRRVSRNALELLTSLMSQHGATEAFRIWHKQTTNEHPRPLKQVWEWLCSAHPTPKELLVDIQKYKFLTITNEENKSIDHAGHRSKGHPKKRHSDLKPVLMPRDIFEKIQIGFRKIK